MREVPAKLATNRDIADQGHLFSTWSATAPLQKSQGLLEMEQKNGDRSFERSSSDRGVVGK